MKTLFSILKFPLVPIAYVLLVVAGIIQITIKAIPSAWNWVYTAERRRARMRKAKLKYQNRMP